MVRQILKVAVVCFVLVMACTKDQSVEGEAQAKRATENTQGSETMSVEEESVEAGSWTVHDLVARARAAVSYDVIRNEMTPPLPSTWPEPTGRVVFYVYRAQSLLTGIDRTSFDGPTHRVEFERGNDEPRVTIFEPVVELGDEKAPGGWPEGFQALMENAAQGLLDVVPGGGVEGAGGSSGATGSAGASGSFLVSGESWEPYRIWLRNHALITEDLRTRHPAFIEWVLAEDD